MLFSYVVIVSMGGKSYFDFIPMLILITVPHLHSKIYLVILILRTNFEVRECLKGVQD